MFNPYDAILDLNNKDDRKLYQDACKGIDKEDQFDGKKEHFHDFTKLLEIDFKKTRVLAAFEISIAWDETASNPEERRLPVADGVVDSFRSKQVTQEQVQAHSELVWSGTTWGNNTPRYFQPGLGIIFIFILHTPLPSLYYAFMAQNYWYEEYPKRYKL